MNIKYKLQTYWYRIKRWFHISRKIPISENTIMHFVLTEYGAKVFNEYERKRYEKILGINTGLEPDYGKIRQYHEGELVHFMLWEIYRRVNESGYDNTMISSEGWIDS